VFFEFASIEIVKINHLTTKIVLNVSIINKNVCIDLLSIFNKDIKLHVNFYLKHILLYYTFKQPLKSTAKEECLKKFHLN